MKVSVRQYAQLIYELQQENGKNDFEQELVFFIRKNKDGKKINKILKKYQELKKEKEGRKDAIIFSRETLDDKSIETIKKAIAEKASVEPGKLSITSEMDQSIGGGLIIKIENEIWDGSLKRKVERIKASMAA